jgi:hypothetical protein
MWHNAEKLRIVVNTVINRDCYFPKKDRAPCTYLVSSIVTSVQRTAMA